MWEREERYPHQLGEAHAPLELVGAWCPVGHAARLRAVVTRARGSRNHQPGVSQTLSSGFRG